MKPAELKNEYILLRAEGKSYSAIAAQLHISKSTCTQWERDLAGQIDELKKARLTELCESYEITKEARIKKLGDTLGKINEALSKADFSTVDPAKLLEYKLKYMEALKGEYAGVKPTLPVESVTANQIMTALGDLLSRVRAGDIPTDQAQKESMILSQLLKACETVELKAKLDELGNILGRLN